MSARGLLAINSKNTPARITITLVSTVCITNNFILFLAPVHVIRAQLSYLPPRGCSQALVWPTETAG